MDWSRAMNWVWRIFAAVVGAMVALFLFTPFETVRCIDEHGSCGWESSIALRLTSYPNWLAPVAALLGAALFLLSVIWLQARARRPSPGPEVTPRTPEP